jgi:hypothetical protein
MLKCLASYRNELWMIYSHFTDNLFLFIEQKFNNLFFHGADKNAIGENNFNKAHKLYSIVNIAQRRH